MPFGLIKQINKTDGTRVYEYGFKESDMDSARQDWEVITRKHQIKHAHKTFPPSPPKIDAFIPRVTVNQTEETIEKHKEENIVKVIRKTNGNFQIVVSDPGGLKGRREFKKAMDD